MPQANKKKAFQTRNVLLVSFAHSVHDIYSAFLSPVLPLLITKLGISYSLSSFLSVLQRLPSLINPFIGLWADRMNLRYLIIISPAITAISMSLLGVAPNYGFLVVLLLVMGVSSALFHVPAPVMIRQVAGDRKGLGMSFYMLGGELARTLGPMVILAAVSWWGFAGSWKLIPFGLAASLLLFLQLRKVQVYKNYEKTQKQLGGWQALRSYMPYLLPVALFLLFNTMVRQSMRFYLPTYLNLSGQSLWMGGIALSVFQVSGAVGTFLGGSLSDKLGRSRILYLAAFTTPLFMWLFLHTQVAWLNFLWLILLGMVSVGTGPVVLAFINDIPTDRMAFLNGTYMSLAFLIGSFDIMLIGFLGDQFSLAQAFEWSVWFSLPAIPAVYWLERNHKRQRQ